MTARRLPPARRAPATPKGGARTRRFLGIVACGLVLALGDTPAEAQNPADQVSAVIDGPPAPQPPDVISRDPAGTLLGLGTRVALDCQRDAPRQPQPAQNEFIDFLFDTFYDRRNAVEFTVNPLGGRMDGQITDERSYNLDWNPIWEVRTGRFENGWTFEAAIPFKSLRYRPGPAQVWGLNIQRSVRWKNELSSLTPLPASRGLASMAQISLAATLIGLEVPAGGVGPSS